MATNFVSLFDNFNQDSLMDISISDQVVAKSDFNSKVYLGTYNGNVVHIKVLSGIFQSKTFVDKDVSELTRLEENRNVLQYFGGRLVDHYAFLVSEVWQTSLEACLLQGSFPLPELDILQQTALGLQFLHNNNTIHGNIKPINVLFTKSAVKLSDYGLQNIKSELLQVFLESNIDIGVMDWSAPEIIRQYQQKQYRNFLTKEGDIFSLGCLYYAVLCNGAHPFGDILSRTRRILGNLPDFDENVTEPRNLHAFPLISSMISCDYKKRPAIGLVLQNPMFWSQKKKKEFINDIRVVILQNKVVSHTMQRIDRQLSKVDFVVWTKNISPLILTQLELLKQPVENGLGNLVNAIVYLTDIEPLRNILSSLDVQTEASKVIKEPCNDMLDYFEKCFPLFIQFLWYAFDGIEPKESILRSYYIANEYNSLPEYFTNKYPSLPQVFCTGDTLISKNFEELCQLNADKEVGLTEEMYAEARQFYNSAMQRHLENSEFIRPQNLKTMHDETVRTCVEKLVARYSLKNDISEDIKAALEPAFKKWNVENTMKLNFDDIAIGIDLGTTYSCVAAYISGKIHIIENDLGKRTTPSYVAFQPDGSKVVGNVAKQRARENPENTIFDAKRILGRKFTDPDLQVDMRFWPFSVIDDGDIPKIKVGSKTYYPEQISASVLKYLKQSAEKFFGKTINKAVITVPAYFNDGQRQATIDAGELAGLKVLSILNEPVAAAIAYKKQHSDNYEHHASSENILVFHLGGGTFDVAILQSKHGELHVLAVDGDEHLGGEDFTIALMCYCAEEFKKQTMIDLFEGRDSVWQKERDWVRRRLKRLQEECERCKIDLTTSCCTEATLDYLFDATGLSVKIRRSTFETINQRLFDKTIEKVVSVLKAAKLDKHEIHDIVLVGGSTRIPKIQKMLSHFFGKKLDTSINPDEAVAYGAAMQAAMMNGAIFRNSTDFTKINDVTPMSIGVELNSGDFSVIIPKNTKVPAKAQRRYRTTHKNQASVQIIIYQGDDPIAVNNKKLGDFYLNGIPPEAAEQEIDVEMSISSQGILHVNAASNSCGAKKSITVIESKQRMAKTLIKRLLESRSI